MVLGLNDGRRDGATAAAAPTARAPKGAPGGNGNSNMSLTAVRKKESKRVRTKESATVSMLTKLLDDDGTAGSRKQQQAKRRRMSQQQQQSASNSGRGASVGGPGGSRAAGVPSFRSANSGSKTSQNANNKHGKHTSVPGRSTGIGNTGKATSSASAGAWSDIVSNASIGSSSTSSGNPFASTSRVGIQAQNTKSKAKASAASAAAAAERAKSLSLARRRAAVMGKNSSKRRQQQVNNQLSRPSNTANSALGVSARAVASTSRGASGEQPTGQLQSFNKKTRPEATTKLPMASTTPSECAPKVGPTDTSTGVASAKTNRSNMDASAGVGISLGLQPTSLLSKKKRPPWPTTMSGTLASTSESFALESNFDVASSSTLTGKSRSMDVDIVGLPSRSIATGPVGIGSGSVSNKTSASHSTSNSESDSAMNITAVAAPPGSASMPTTESNLVERTFDDRSYNSTSYQSAAAHDATGIITKKRRKAPNNDNFVKLNLRNSAGSCRGARNKKGKRGGGRYGGRGSYGRGGSSYNSQKPYSGGNGSDDENDSDNDWKSRRREKGGVRLVQNSSAGIDPLDDYLDGTYGVGQKKIQSAGKSSSASKDNAESTSFAPSNMTADEKQASQTKARADQIPRCTRHQRPCKLLTVRKSNTGNKGRKFYVCGLPKGEQCDFFQWEDDTVHSIQKALLQSSSTSGFVARQVAAYVDRFKALTLPELRDEAKRLGLRHVGKKGQLLARLTIHVRDEVAKSVVADDEKGSDDGIIDLVPAVPQDSKTLPAADDDDGSCSSSSEESSCTSSSSSSEGDELELVGDECNDDHDPKEGSVSDEECVNVENNNNDDDNDSEEEESDSDPIYKALHTFFGYRNFRPGQEWAIRRVLQQERSLLVAPTGLGKSMCYALPATQVEGVCLVVSPLISLMQDQLRHLPPNIPAATLSGNLSSVQVAMTIDDLMKNRIKILFVSPERLASPAFRRLIRPKFNTETRQYERQFPTVSLLCLDEAHCLSQWGHNFRPSYLRIRSLVPMLEPKSILALTATAGPMVIKDICHTLGIPMSSRGGIDNDGVRVLDCKRDNIDVATLIMDSEDSRRSLLYKILKGKKQQEHSDDRFDLQLSKTMSSNSAIQVGCLSKGSVIVYVWRQRDAETVTEQLLGAGVQGGVVCYHGGMGAGDRAKAQGKFMRGKARVCVATVAFGLGINKADVKGVIHLCLPPSLEHHLQEIGRAGRNGSKSRAIALVLSDEVQIRSSLSHSDCIARSQVEKLCLVMRDLVDNALRDFVPEDKVSGDSNSPVSESTSLPIIPVQSIDIALPIASTIGAIDCKEAMIETMLSLLEENTDSFSALLSVEGNLTDEVIVTLKRRSLDKLCGNEAIARSIEKCSQRLDEKEKTTDTSGTDNPLEENLKKEGGTALQKGFLAYSLGTYKFSVLRCARLMGPRAEPRHVFAALRRLQSSGELELALDRTEKGKCLHLRLNMEGIACFRSPESQTQSGNDSGTSLDSVIDRLTSHCAKQVTTGSTKVAKMHQIIHQVAAVEDGEGEEEREMEQGTQTVDCAGGDDVASIDSSSEPGKSARLILFQKLAKEYFESEGKESQGTSRPSQVAPGSSSTTDTTSVPEIAKELSVKDSQEYGRLATDTISLLRDSNLRQKGQQYPIAVTIGDPSCTDYASCCLAKILHGIDSTRAPMSDWRMHPLFGKWRHCSFTSVRSCVETIIKESLS